MIGKFLFASPLAILGDIFNMLILTKYLKTILIERNQIIKDFTECDKWKGLIL